MLEPAGPMLCFVHFVCIGSDSATVNSLVGGHLENWKKCPLVELSAYKSALTQSWLYYSGWSGDKDPICPHQNKLSPIL